MAQYVMTMNRVAKVVPPKRFILKDISLSFFPGAKIGVLGLNGAGKSTLLKIMAGVDKEIDGEITWQNDLKIGYLPQEPQLDPEATVRQAVEEGMGDLIQSQAKLDAGYAAYAEPDADFDALAAEQARLEAIIAAAGTDASTQMEIAADALRLPPWDAKIGHLSGGEKRRVALCRLLLSRPDMLLLDEPTNHLYMRSKDVLKEAIREFDGTVILVSHDRDFLDGLATKVYEFGGGVVKEHLGGIYEFLQKKKIDSLNELQKGAGLSASPTATAKGNGEQEAVQPSENKLSYEAQKELNKKIKKLERQVADCEASIEETEAAIAIVEEKMATPEGASDMQLYERHQKLKQQLDTIVEEWERVSIELEEVKG